MRDLLSKLDALVSETALKDKEDLEAKRKALDDLEADPVASKDPEISAAIDQRRADLEKEADSKGFTESQDTFQVGDDFGISFSEDFEIAAEIVDILEDGIVIELDDTAMEYLALEGFTYEDGELVEGVAGPQSCWKGYRKVGTKPGTGKNAGKRVNDCEKISEYFQFDFPEKKDRGPRDSGHDELERREKSFKKHELAKDGRDYKDAMSPKSKSPLKGKFNIAGPKGKLPEDAVAEGSAHGYNVARYFEKYKDQRKITNWLRTNAGLDKTAPVYFDDADLVYGEETIVPDALVNPKYKMSDLLDAVKQAAGGMAESEEGFSIEDMVMDQWRNGSEVWQIASSMGMDEGEVQGIIDDSENGVREAEYQGRKVPLGKPMAGDVKKSKVYVKNPQGRVVKVNFGDKKMRIKKSNPNRRKSFRARHNCANPGPRHKARYWSCRAW